MFVLAFAPAPIPASWLSPPAFAQGNCPNCDLPPGCRGNGNNKDKGNNGNGRGRPDCERLELIIESDLDFGRLVLLGDGESRVVLDLTSGAKTIIGDADDLGGMPFTGRAVVTGAPYQQVSIFLPAQVDMRDPNGGNAIIQDFVMDTDPFSTLDSDGRLEFNFSATLVLGSEQTGAGKLRGRIPISVEYP
ncbi:DUF4402 domain-containing protein [Erythrobacter sp. SCSIO 43205]|uniref:DUF4402 domain-containing protein n=1 Tax=Erythrobacter sp. SCSIO 43205 TaxID=2779361 RepID=UPI001CA9B355|nr:DUF4402 domain-containing protein [Erythrobacter sp. SCSIO 43205]UAB78876.1 DUF4402 domain-containing protein [Erythrobacter sp. SCSIO 43205]